MSWIDVRDRDRDSPERARSLFTVLAAISSARSSPVPRSSWLSLMCSYWRARFVPFFTPRGGMSHLHRRTNGSYETYPAAIEGNGRSGRHGRVAGIGVES